MQNLLNDLLTFGFTSAKVENNRLLLTNWNYVEGFDEVNYGLDLPKKQVDLMWVLNKLNKKSNFVNFSEQFKKLVPINGVSIYATSYGIGVFIFANNMANEIISFIDEKLKSLGIEFTNEYSDAFLVWRYKISKSSANIQKINSL